VLLCSVGATAALVAFLSDAPKRTIARTRPGLPRQIRPSSDANRGSPGPPRGSQVAEDRPRTVDADAIPKLRAFNDDTSGTYTIKDRRRITGRLDPAMAGAAVELRGPENKLVETVETDGAGRFEFPEVAWGYFQPWDAGFAQPLRYSLVLVDSRFAPAAVGDVEPGNGDFVLSATAGGTVNVLVRSGGQPARGVRVRLVYSLDVDPPVHEIDREGRTDELGWFRFRCVAPGRTRFLAAYPEGAARVTVTRGGETESLFDRDTVIELP